MSQYIVRTPNQLFAAFDPARDQFAAFDMMEAEAVAYCREVLGLSQDAAWHKVEAAVMEFPFARMNGEAGRRPGEDLTRWYACLRRMRSHCDDRIMIAKTAKPHVWAGQVPAGKLERAPDLKLVRNALVELDPPKPQPEVAPPDAHDGNRRDGDHREQEPAGPREPAPVGTERGPRKPFGRGSGRNRQGN